MQQDQQAKVKLGSIMKPEFSGTDAQKVIITVFLKNTIVFARIIL